jgi:diacylglycerol O-acyltransferase-1
LKNCAVRDEGSKKVKGFKERVVGTATTHAHASDPSLGSTTTTDNNEEEEDPPEKHEAGSHYYVFSVHLRTTTTTNQEEEDTIVPLLRFSTQSYAEKMLWIDLISQTCEYCNSEEYNRHMQQQQQQQPMTGVIAATPTIPPQQQQQQHTKKQERGTLPALVFEAPPSIPPSYHDATGGFHKRGASFRSKSTKKDAARTNHIPYPPSKPMHRQSNPSYLSSDDNADETKTQNYRGFFNLLLIILVVSNFRLLLDAVSKHGFILSKIYSSVQDGVNTWSDSSKSLLIDLPFLSGLLIVQAFIVGAYSIEKILCQRQYIGEYVGLALHFINTNSALGVVILIVWYLIEHPIVGAILIMQATITWLKLISYVHANYDHRLTMMSSSSSTENNTNNNIGTGPNNMQQLALVKDLDPCDTKLVYPNNVTLSDIYYFWFAPTLTYQLAYPRSPYIRWMKVLTLFGQLIICVLLVIFIAAQVIAPTLDLLVHDLETSRGELRTQTIGDYLLKLSISSTYIWLLVFYGFFHCFLNLTAEILRFGDRGESHFFV